MSAYEGSWDRPHQPGPSALWQESDCYWFYDEATGVGGFHRVGQKPSEGTGQVTMFAFARDAERCVVRAELELGDKHRWDDGQAVGSHRVEALAGGRMSYAWNELGSAAELEFYEQFYEPRDWSTSGHGAEALDELNPDGHLECSGRLRGELRIGDRSYEIDALAHRDRSWGVRDVSRISPHRFRMFSGTVGPALSWATFTIDLKGGPAMATGFVVRNGVEDDVRRLRVLTTFDADGLSPVGATALLALETGEVLRVACQGVQGFTTPVPEMQTATSDTISTVSWDGSRGFCDLELCNNPGRGTYVPTQADVTLLAVDEGVSRCDSYEI